MSNSTTCPPPRLAGLTRQNIALIVFVAIGVVLGAVAAYLFTSSTVRWIVVIALGLGLLAGGTALAMHYLQ